MVGRVADAPGRTDWISEARTGRVWEPWCLPLCSSLTCWRWPLACRSVYGGEFGYAEGDTCEDTLNKLLLDMLRARQDAAVLRCRAPIFRTACARCCPGPGPRRREERRSQRAGSTGRCWRQRRRSQVGIHCRPAPGVTRRGRAPLGRPLPLLGSSSSSQQEKKGADPALSRRFDPRALFPAPGWQRQADLGV